MAEHELEKEFEAVRADITKLRADLGGVTEALREMTKARAEGAREGLSSLAGTVREEVRRGLERGRKSVETVEDRIEQQPVVSLLIAFGAGLLLGKVLDRS
ncbi:MAG: hypothetical protein HY900_22225 [Deltaproteobacteria bacterium]|nr:hypothetical protein [Deltaproteobacteria bacterium]